MNYEANVQPCGDGWCVETASGMEGPLDNQAEALHYASLLKCVDAARVEMACTEGECL